MAATLLPALKKARVAAVNANCLSNIRQVAIAMLAYEADNKRLPVHNSEAAYGPGNSGGRWAGAPFHAQFAADDNVATVPSVYQGAGKLQQKFRVAGGRETWVWR